MKRPQLLLILAGVALTILLFQLPKVVVENEQLQEIEPQDVEANHTFEIPVEVKSELARLKDSLDKSSDIDKKTKFALALAGAYLDYGLLDSAAYYGDQLARWHDRPQAEVADVYFKAYERSQDPNRKKAFATQASGIYKALLDKDPANLFLKNRLAMTLVVTDNPMAGIMMLREITEEDPENREAILNLGLLSIQSGQYERAKARFEKLVELDPSDHEAKLYLAVTLMEINDSDRARSVLNEILVTNDSIPAIKAMASQYLNSL